MITHLVFHGVADGPLGVALDIISTAAHLARAGAAPGPVLTQRIVSVDGSPVRTGAGRSLAVDGALSGRGPRRGEVLVLPGVGAATETRIAELLAREEVQRGAALIAKAAARGVLVAASCSATFVLGAAGVLDGKPATTTWWLRDSFARRFPRVLLRTAQMVVPAEGVITAGAALAHADLLLALVSRTAGPTLAHWVTRYLLLEERTSQARYMAATQLRSADPILRAVEDFIRSNLSRQLSLHELARAAGTSPRTLARRLQDTLGTTPRAFMQRLKMAHAVQLLETTRGPVEEIAAQVGYADAAAFRRIFRRETGEAPRQRRDRLHTQSQA